MGHNTWMHRAVRPVARSLARTRVTPNQVTTLRLVAGLAAAAFAEGSEAWRAWGAGIFLLAMFLDRADGELARLSGKISSRGHTYDLISDGLSDALAFTGLGVGLRAGVFYGWAPLMGLVAGLAIATTFWMIAKLQERHGQHAGEFSAGASFAPDDARLVLPVVVWVGLPDWLLATACLGAPAVAPFMGVKFRADLRKP